MNTFLVVVDSHRKSEGLRTSIVDAENLDDVMERYFGRSGKDLRWTAFKLREKMYYTAYRVYSTDDEATHGVIINLSANEKR